MQPTNYWGEVPLPTEPQRTPMTFLREQAEVLTKATNGILTGEVVRANFDDKLGGTLRVVAPLLGGYSLAIVAVEYSIYGYPAVVTNMLVTGEQFAVHTVVDFQLQLRRILSSEAVRNALAALLAQSNG